MIGYNSSLPTQINSVGPLVLFQAVWPLLKTSPAPKFVPVTSMVGSVEVGSLFDIDNIPYGTSKAALNWITRKLHHDFPELSEYCAFPCRNCTPSITEY